MNDHVWIETTWLIIQCTRAQKHHIIEDKWYQRILVAKRVFLLQHNDDADANCQSVAGCLTRQAWQKDYQRAVLDQHEDVGQLVPTVGRQEDVLSRFDRGQVEGDRATVDQKAQGWHFDQNYV